MRIILTTICCLLMVGAIAQQNKSFTPINFPGRDTELANAKSAIEKGDEYYRKGAEYNKLALRYFLTAYDFNPDEAALNYKIGRCYLFGSTEREKAAQYINKAKMLQANVSPQVDLMLGKAHQIRLEFDTAIICYKSYLAGAKMKNDQTEAKKTERLIEECKFGKQQLINRQRVFIDNMGDDINSVYPDYDPVITSDNSMLLFTSRREGIGGQKDEELNEYYEDIWVSYHVNGHWTKAENLGEPVNSKSHDAVVGLSPDGQRLMTYQEGDIYQSYLEGLHWSKPKKLVKTINTEAHESSASFSFDDQQLFFISERPGGQGKKDIWVSQWDDNKWKWAEPTNLGGTINTPMNEETVFAHPDGKTLYFSSEGHLGMGNYDIYKTSLQENGSWSNPENLGYPINTPGEDLSFVLAANGKHGYYASANSNSIGQRDIFEITFLGPEKTLALSSEDDLLSGIKTTLPASMKAPKIEVLTAQVSIFKGIVTDEESTQPIASKIEIYNNTTGELVLTSKSNSASGKFLTALPAGADYNIAVKAEGYLFHSENFVIPESAVYKEVKKDIALKPLKVGAAIVLNNIFFDFDKSTLRDASKVELKNIQDLMENNKTLKVELSGHTDSKGSDNYNQKLSESRAKAVVDYLVKQGIAIDRMSFVGLGETKPIADNATEEGQQQNRRTEIKVTAR